jgi:hypothetical protein
MRLVAAMMHLAISLIPALFTVGLLVGTLSLGRRSV